MIKYIIFFSLILTSVKATLIPAARLASWTPGTNVGVDGGIAQYLNGSGDPDERTTASLRNVVSADSVDNTGATDVAAALLTSWNTSSPGTGIYLPAGVYRTDSSVNLGHSTINKTVRGAGSWTRSTSSNTIAGSGAKTFTVISGGPWTSGIGIRVRGRNDIANWMQGTVTSYSGTTLVIAVTSSEGSGTLTDWDISRTFIDNRGGSGAFIIGGGVSSNYFDGTAWVYPGVANAVNITTTALRGDTDVIVENASGFAVGDLCSVYAGNRNTADVFLAGESAVLAFNGSGPEFPDEYLRRTLNRITAISGTTITLDTPLQYDLPLAKVPRFYSSAFKCQRVGIESLSIQCDGPQIGLEIRESMNCWLYDISVDASANYGIKNIATYKCTIQKCSIIGDFAISSNHSGYLHNSSCNALVVNNIITGYFPGMEVNAAATNNAFIGNYVTQADGLCYILANHGPHNSFNLWEHNITSLWKSDGYFGTMSEDTLNRNWITGEGITAGIIAANRGTYNCNYVGNVLGWTSLYNGSMGYGFPNISNSETSGSVSQPVVDGSFWLHYNGTGTLIGAVSNQASRIITLDTLPASALQIPNVTSGVFFPYTSIHWLTYRNRLLTSGNSGIGIFPIGFSGNNITFEGAHANFSVTSITREGSIATLTTSAAHGLATWASIWVSGATQSEYNGMYSIDAVPSATTITYTISGTPATPATGTIIANDFPPNGTVVVINPSNAGYQELDGQVEATSIEKGNYFVSGSGGSQSTTSGDPLVDSYAYAAKPDWWGDLPWPGVNPASPSFSRQIIPAGYRFINGEDVPESGLDVTTLTATNSTTTNLVLP
jgi:hypothetical protein